MEFVNDVKWEKEKSISQLVNNFETLGFQSRQLSAAKKVIVRMKKEGAKIYLTYTSNMVTSGLRGFFAQLIQLGMADVIVTTVGGVEEDIMKAFGEKFIIGKFSEDDVELYEKGINRVGNLLVTNESYCKLEDSLTKIIRELCGEKTRWTPSELLRAIGLRLEDKNSILYQAAKNNVPIFVPAITDGAFGFHLFMQQQKQDDFVVDVVGDFRNIMLSTSHDEKKGIISLGGSVSKHHAIMACLLNGGLDFAVYMTTARPTSGSMSGATTNEAKSWGKIKDDSDAATVLGDVTVNFPLAMMAALDELEKENLLRKE